MSRHYVPQNIVIAMAGNIETSFAEELAEKYFSRLSPCSAEKFHVDVKLTAKSLLRKKNIEQIHLGLAFPSVKRYDRLFDATQIMNCILGGSMSVSYTHLTLPTKRS